LQKYKNICIVIRFILIVNYALSCLGWRVGEPNMAKPFLAWGCFCGLSVTKTAEASWH